MSSMYEFLQLASDPGSALFGKDRNSLGMKRKPGDAKLIDWFGSPQMAGTEAQPYGRLGALAYGGYMGAGALGALGGLGSGATTATAAPTSAPAASGMTAGNYLQGAGLASSMLAPRGGGGAMPVMPPLPPQQQRQPPRFAANSPYARMLAMRGLMPPPDERYG